MVTNGKLFALQIHANVYVFARLFNEHELLPFACNNYNFYKLKLFIGDSFGKISCFFFYFVQSHNNMSKNWAMSYFCVWWLTIANRYSKNTIYKVEKKQQKGKTEQ